jgi:hypothetical protein
MANQGFSALLNNLPSPAYAGTALANSTSLTDISPVPNVTIPANSLMTGQVIRVTARCKFSNVTAAPSLLLGIYYGGVAGVKLCAIGATATTITAANWPIEVRALLTVQTVGASGSIMPSGEVLLGTSLTAWTAIPMDASATAAVTVDTTTAKALTLGAQWSGGSAPSASDTIQCLQWVVEGLN